MSRHRSEARQLPQLLAEGRAEGPGHVDRVRAAPDDEPRVVPDVEQDDVTSHGEIASVAYGLWLDRGRPEGTHREDWLEAECRLGEERG
ncbi:DUF2934 domain-containing protein, partial [Singulisphaera rosea]